MPRSKEESGDAGAGEQGGQDGLKPGGTGENGEIVGGPRTPQQMMAQKRMQQTQAQVDSVSVIIFKTWKLKNHKNRNNNKFKILSEETYIYIHICGNIFFYKILRQSVAIINEKQTISSL